MASKLSWFSIEIKHGCRDFKSLLQILLEILPSPLAKREGESPRFEGWEFSSAFSVCIKNERKLSTTLKKKMGQNPRENIYQQMSKCMENYIPLESYIPLTWSVKSSARSTDCQHIRNQNFKEIVCHRTLIHKAPFLNGRFRTSESSWKSVGGSTKVDISRIFDQMDAILLVRVYITDNFSDKSRKQKKKAHFSS